jgi:exosortase
LPRLVHVWYTQPEYGHGFFVLPFSLFLLWYRQDMVDPWPQKGSWLGIPVLVFWLAARVFVYQGQYDVDAWTILLLLPGLTLLLGGLRALLWAWPSILFLVFMLPWPDSVSVYFAQPLQHWATIMSVYTLQTVGVAASNSGDSNVINLSEAAGSLEVARACSGLSMLTLFFAICVGASFVSKLVWPEIRTWEKIVLVVSAVPIAIVSNVARISLTGMLSEWISSDVGKKFHDNGGWLMMVPAMLLIWGEMSLLANLFIDNTSEGPLSFGERKHGQPMRKRSRPQMF